MRYTQLFAKTIKTIAADETSVNAQYLLKGGFIDRLMAGSFTLLPLGLRVEKKIEYIVREEMNATGAQEILMPLLHPKNIWNETGRWDSAREVMYQFKKDDKEYGLSFTHEEIVMDLIRKHISSYKDFPIKIYHFSTKFRDELRAKSGILRGREFLMKDLYSAHVSKEDMMDYYWRVADAYIKVFKRLGIDVKVTEASGGVFTEEFTHEFQALAEGGEDTIYYCNECDFAQNKEIFKGHVNETCPKCKKGKIQEAKSIEVGNIFPLGTRYAEKMNTHFTDASGQKQPVWLASYGIGITRLIGALVEIYHDTKGIIWPESVAPYKAYLINLQKDSKRTEDLYHQLVKNNVEVLFDDRIEVSAGEKFANADLLGMPYRLVVSEKTGEDIEVKKRSSDKLEVISQDALLKTLISEA